MGVLLLHRGALYGSSSLRGNFQAWGRNRFLLKGYAPGDKVGNLAFAAHALVAGVIALGGALQLIPTLRNRAMWLHRWNGRLFIFSAALASGSGLYMSWVRGARLNVLTAIGSTVNVVLIFAFAAMAIRTAMKHDVAAHRRWALRTYLAVNGQWFIRVGTVAWMVVAKGHDYGFFAFWDFGCYLVPLAVLEWYFWVQRTGESRSRFAFASALIVLTLIMAFGSIGLSAFLYLKILMKA